MQQDTFRASYRWSHGPIGAMLSACVFLAFETFILYSFQPTIAFIAMVCLFAVGIIIRLNECRLFVTIAPAQVDVGEDSLLCRFVFGKTVIVPIREITRITKTTSFFEQWSFSAVLDCQSRNIRLLFAQHTLRNWIPLVGSLIAKHPNCKIDESLVPRKPIVDVEDGASD